MKDLVPLCQIGAVVPTFNRMDALRKCLQALLHQNRPLDGILVVDNASTDGTEDMIRMEFPTAAQTARLPENTGSAGGFHEGIRIAYEKGWDWVWCMDNDAEPAPDCLQILTASPQFHDPRVGGLAALVVDQDGKIQAMHHKRAVIPFEKPALTDLSPDRRPEIPLVANGWAGILIRRSAIEAVGLPRKEFFLFSDDVEYTYRISKTSRIFLIANGKVVHKSDGRWIKAAAGGRVESVRWPSDQLWRLYYDVRNRFFFITRYASIGASALALPLILARKIAGIALFDDRKAKRISILLRAVKDGVLGRLHAAADFRS